MSKSKDALNTSDALPVTYELALQELEELVQQMESSQLPLDHLLQAYQRGAALLKFCREKLTSIEDQIKVLDEGHLKTWTDNT
ncbi:MAG: exodeoxyribonuclease VII small subunit [Burkholderiaceae bacterium]|jgi:exodeoxyribonuclease VII small subunit